jgi:tripartite-type tricarboxylate transporter receptor subunit TctC
MSMELSRGRCCVALALAVTGFLSAVASAHAQEYPSRPVRILLPFPPGGGSDQIARIVTQKFSELLGQQVIIDNRAGASGNIAGELAAKAAPDGYTLLFGNSSLAISPGVFRKMPFSPSNDLVAISSASSYPFTLVSHPSLPVKSVKDLVALAKAKPNALDYASAGAGTMSHMAMEMLRVKTGTQITHLPYKGAAPAMTSLLTGEAQTAFLVMPVAAPQIKAGKLRGLGVAAPKRAAVVPEVPTMIEAGVAGHVALQWNGLFAPAKTPQPILDRLNRDWVAAVKTASVSKRIIASGADPGGDTAAEFAAFVKQETARWTEVAKASGTKLD